MPKDDHETGGPAYLRIAADLRAAITNGEIPTAAKLPSVAEIAKRYGVSVIVVNNALALLKGEGIVESQRGSGHRVAHVRRLVREAHRRDMRTAGVPTSPFARDAARAGHRGGWLHESMRTTAGLDVATRLGIDPEAAVMQTEYLFTADDEPIQLSTSWEPLALTGGTSIEWPEDGAAVGVVARFDLIDVRIDECEERVRDRSATPHEIHRLHLPVRRAHVQTVTRIYYAAGRAVETADIVFPAGRYELVYRFPID